MLSLLKDMLMDLYIYTDSQNGLLMPQKSTVFRHVLCILKHQSVFFFFTCKYLLRYLRVVFMVNGFIDETNVLLLVTC